MGKNTVGENSKRAMAKALMGEVLKMMEDENRTAISKEELIAHLEQFQREEVIEKQIVESTEGQNIKERFWAGGAPIPASDTTLLCKVEDADRNGYIQLQKEYSIIRSMLHNETFCEELWNEHNADTALMFSIVRDGVYAGYCGIKNIMQEPWEIAIELLPEQTRRGIGTMAITAMLNALRDRLGVRSYRVRIEPKNVISQRLFKKLGATPNGISELLLHGKDEIEQCEELYLHQIDDNLCAVAEKFGVQPRELLSHVLEYSLHWN